MIVTVGRNTLKRIPYLAVLGKNMISKDKIEQDIFISNIELK